MPLGDPHGGNFEYTDEGLPLDVFISSIPSPDPQKSCKFYTEILGLIPIAVCEDEVYLRRMHCTIRIFRSENYGIDTGLYIGVEDPYDLHRRLIDEGVRFKMDPKRTPMGVATSFFDSDGNIVYAIERGAVPCDDNINRAENRVA